MTQAKDIVRELAEEGGAVFVTFQKHQGVFQMPPGDEAARAAATRSRDFQQQITFSFNAEARITALAAPAPEVKSFVPSGTPPKNG